MGLAMDMAFYLGLAYLALFVVGLIGWAINIFDIVHTHVLNGLAVCRVIGVFLAPLGALLGWFF